MQVPRDDETALVATESEGDAPTRPYKHRFASYELLPLGLLLVLGVAGCLSRPHWRSSTGARSPSPEHSVSLFSASNLTDSVNGTVDSANDALDAAADSVSDRTPGDRGIRTLNSASGIKIWEDTASHPTFPWPPRFAVAYVWSDPGIFYEQQKWAMHEDSFVGPYAHGRGACGLALSAIASKRLLQESVGPDAIADAVVLTDGIADDHASYFKELGIRVLSTNMTALYTFDKFDFNTTYHEDHQAAYFKLRASSMKAGLAGLLEYRFIIYLDVDAYLKAPLPYPNPWHGLNNGRSEFLSKDDRTAPLSVGCFAIKPQQDAFEDMIKLIKIGFSPQTGWGFRKYRIGPERWPKCDCNAYLDNITGSYCSDPNTSRWDFIGAEGDKGILFTEYAIVRDTLTSVDKDEWQRRLSAYNFWGPYKPWMHDNPCVDWGIENESLQHIPEYWSLYKNYSRPAMASDQVASSFNTFCISELDKGLKSYEHCASDSK